MNPARRRLIFAGIAGAMLLGLARVIERPSGPANVEAPRAAGALSADGVEVMHALLPALLAGALPSDPATRARALDDTLAGIATAIEGLAPIAREELTSLFALLAWAPLRWVLGGSFVSLSAMTQADADVFLDSLRTSRLSRKRAAYDALHQITFAAWYANPLSWPAIGYPGPPELS